MIRPELHSHSGDKCVRTPAYYAFELVGAPDTPTPRDVAVIAKGMEIVIASAPLLVITIEAKVV